MRGNEKNLDEENDMLNIFKDGVRLKLLMKINLAGKFSQVTSEIMIDLQEIANFQHCKIAFELQDQLGFVQEHKLLFCKIKHSVCEGEGFKVKLV